MSSHVPGIIFISDFFGILCVLSIEPKSSEILVEK